MKKQLAIFVVLFILFSSSLNIAYKILPLVKATPVEGVITQDTIWTLVDSPFVVTNDVTVNPEATLTIEPGVEVRFGENFSLIVNGRIVAIGTEERKILFTTNDPTHNAIWETIELRGPQSSFVNCIIEYGKDGATLENGLTNIDYCEVRSNLENGIRIDGGGVAVRNSEIADNKVNAVNIGGGNWVTIENCLINASGSGIRIAGGDQVNVLSNVIKSNGNGLVLTGQLTGNIDIRQNEISLSTENGVLLQPDVCSNTIITENNVSGNKCGFFVSASASTYITRNYISNNTVGITYTGTVDHQAYFNDIYDNERGIDLDPPYTGTINATHNYWGHKTGPKHNSLNPYGKGNSVGGNGVDLTFIPFLTHSFTYNNIPPTAVVWTDKVLVAPYQTITFVGTDSQDDGSVVQYFFDFKDTTNSGWIPLSLFNHSYALTGVYWVGLAVEDDFGSESAPAFARVDVADLTPLETSVTLSTSTLPYNGDTWVTVYVSTGSTGVADANVTLFSVGGGNFDPQSGLTDANGYFGTKFTAPNVTETTDVRIIARASMNGYADGSDYKYIRVLPPLKVQVIPVLSTIISEETKTLNIHVTNDFDDPVAGVDLTLSCNNGMLSAYTGTTDSNGVATFNFTAPLTLSQINVTVTVTSNKAGYAEGHDDITITVEPRRLVLEVASNPSTILSEETATITVRVTFDSVPISNATVTMSSDVGGNFSTTTQLTDPAGNARFAFTAPQTSLSDGVNVTITARATKSGYVDAESQTVVPIEPKVLSVDILPALSATYSQGRLNVTVHVRYENSSIQGANVTITAVSGNFVPSTAATDGSGNATFTFTAPQVDGALNVTISANVTKEGYLESTGQSDITVNPRTFGFQVKPSTIRVGQAETLTIYATCKEDGTVVDGATVTISYENGDPLTNVTDVNGVCTFMINTPQTPTDTLNITVSLARSGYEQEQATIILNVAPEEGGFPWITILLIAVPIVVIVLAIILIKFRLIVVSTNEETEAQ